MKEHTQEVGNKKVLPSGRNSKKMGTPHYSGDFLWSIYSVLVRMMFSYEALG